MGKSSKDKRDAYYRLAKEQGWRARSAFKLIQLDEQFDLFKDVTRVVDLCAAPGSWSQVLSRVLIKGEGFGRRRWEEKQRRNQEVVFGKKVVVSSDDTPRNDDEEEEEERELDTLSSPAGEKLQPRENVRIVAIDLQPISPLPGITTLVGDITHPSTPPRILAALNDPSSPSSPSPSSPSTQSIQIQFVDLILSDGAPDVTGLHDLDIYIQSSLLSSALSLALKILKPGGTFVAKIFRGKDVDFLYAQLRFYFAKVEVAKPRSSRASSLEAFVVCREFFGGLAEGEKGEVRLGGGVAPPVGGKEGDGGGEGDGGVATDGKEGGGWKNGQKRTQREDGITILEFEKDEKDERRWIAPFVACGDLSAWDSDATYHLPKGRVSLDPVQPPTAPPYKRALEVRRQMGGAYGKTGKGSGGSLG